METKTKIECDRRQWRIEKLIMSKMLLMRALRDLTDNDGFNALYEIDELIDHELDQQRYFGNHNKQLKFIDHVLLHCDCEFVDDMMTHIGERFKLYYMNDISDVD